MEWLLSTRGPMGRGPFALRTAGILLVGGMAGRLVYEAGYRLLHFQAVGVYFAIIVAFLAAVTWFIQVIRRAQDLGKPSVLMFAPVYNLYLLALLFFKEGKSNNV